MKARRAPPVVPQTEDPLADLTCAKSLTPKPAGWHLPEELTCHVRLNVRPDGVERGPSMRGGSMVGAGRDGAEEPGGAGGGGRVKSLGRRGVSRRGAATAVAGRGGGGTAGQVARESGRAEAAGPGRRYGEGPGDSSIGIKRLVRSGPMKPGGSTGQGLGTQVRSNDRR